MVLAVEEGVEPCQSTYSSLTTRAPEEAVIYFITRFLT